MTDTSTDTWRTLKAWPELILEQLDDAGVARVLQRQGQVGLAQQNVGHTPPEPLPTACTGDQP